MSEIIPYDSDLITKSANYHGHDLIKLLVAQNAEKIKAIKLQDINYEIYQERSEIIRRNRSRELEILQFIGSKSELLLTGDNSSINIAANNPNYKDVYEKQFPLEFYIRASSSLRVSQLLKHIKKGDILNTMVCSLDEDKNYRMKVISCDNGKHLYLSDFNQSFLKITMKASDTSVDRVDGSDIGQNWIIGTRLRVEVLSCDEPAKAIYVGTKGVTTDSSQNIKFGKIIIADLPAIFTSNFKFRYLSECVERLKINKNPKATELLAEQYGIILTEYPSLMSSIRREIPKDDKAPSLRQAQLSKWAHKHVADGVNQFKTGNHTLAFQCIEKALKIDPENEEAFVAKGALLANLSHYEKAIEEFQKALKFNPDHHNANKYMCETLVELGRQYKEDDNVTEAEVCFKRCIEIDEDHAGARECIAELAKETGNMDLLLLLERKKLKEEENNDILSEITAMEEEYIMKKKEESSPVVEKASVPSKDPPLSPLSQKMAMNVNMWQQASNPPPQLFNQMSYYEEMNYCTPPNVLPNQLRQSFPPSQQPEILTYDQRVADFLKSMERRAPSLEKNNDNQHRKRTHDSSRSRKRYSTSSSSSSSSSSNSSSSSSSSGSNRRRRHKKKKNSSRRGSRNHRRRSESKKKDAKAKKRTRSSSTSDSESSGRSKSAKGKSRAKNSTKTTSKKSKSNTNLTDFDNLEKKLEAYYKKINDFNSSSNSPADTKIKSKPNTDTKSPGKLFSEPVKKYMEVNVNQKTLQVHPAFMQSSDSSDSDEPKKKISNSNIKDIVRSGRALAYNIEIKKRELLEKEKNKAKLPSRSPRYGYYSNKPVYRQGKKPAGKQRLEPALCSKFDEAKLSHKLDSKKKIDIVKDVSKHNTQNQYKPPKVESRFGKWSNNSKAPNSNTTESGVDMFQGAKNFEDTNKQVPNQTLAECEKFLQKAKEKRLELMRERNKGFVKPNIE